jgi:hypothetical protein
MSSVMSSYQPEELTGEGQEDILMIGGIEVFLPLSLVEARACIAEVATVGEGQLALTVIEGEEVEQISEATQAEEGKEHSEEWLKIFIQETKREKTAALELATEEEEEEENNMDFTDLCEELEAL